MISVIFWCYSRQEHLNAVLPKWLEQQGVDYEIVIGCGPDIKLPDDKRIVRIAAPPPPKMGRAYNLLLAKAKGEILLITQCDLEVNDPLQLVRMTEYLKPRTIVSERFFKDGNRQAGCFLQFLMARKADIEAVGAWYEAYDCPCYVGHEDSDLIARLLESGINLKLIETPGDRGVYHIHHAQNHIFGNDILADRIKNGKALYGSRHDTGVLSLYVKQFARNMREMREEAERAKGNKLLT